MRPRRPRAFMRTVMSIVFVCKSMDPSPVKTVEGVEVRKSRVRKTPFLTLFGVPEQQVPLQLHRVEIVCFRLGIVERVQHDLAKGIGFFA